MKIPLNDIIHLFIAIGGLTYIVTLGKILREFREAITTKRCNIEKNKKKNLWQKIGYLFWLKTDELFNCQLCFGLWSTLICLGLYYYCGIAGQLILFCFEGAIISLFIYSVIKYFKDI